MSREVILFDGACTLNLNFSEKLGTYEFEDSGTAYDPLSADAPDITLSAEERKVGGLGFFMVKNIMDSVEYRRNGNKIILTIKKKIE